MLPSRTAPSGRGYLAVALLAVACVRHEGRSVIRSNAPARTADVKLLARTDTALSEEAWIPPEITLGKTPVRVLITKTGWRGGSQALVMEQPKEVRQLYESLAGNARLGWTCGYHWNFLFQYATAPAESIDINENCETFRRNAKQTWQVVSSAFRRAKENPSHFVVVVVPRQGIDREQLAETANRFGLLLPTISNSFIVASQQHWSPSRVKELTASMRGLAEVKPIEEYDTGN